MRTHRAIVAVTALVSLASATDAQVSNPDGRKTREPFTRVTGGVLHGPFHARDGNAGGFPASNVTLLAWIPLNNFPNDQHSGNDCWGYVSASGREYALFGMQSGFSVLDVTNPTYPEQIGFIPGNQSLWRDIKVIADFAYGVSEGGLGIQVIDLSQVDSGVVTHVQNKMQNGHNSTHNIAANTETGYLYLCGANIANGGLVAVSTADPADPVIEGAWTTRYVHDAQIVTYTSGPYAGREIAYCCTGGRGLDVVDVTDKSNMFRIGGLQYDGTHYCHQAWLSEDRRFLFVDDEMDEGTSFAVTTTHVLDVSDPAHPVEVTTFTSGSASTDHNLYVVGDIAYEANYMSGLRVFDVSDPFAAREIAYLDTAPDKDAPGYHGAWSTYPFFPSGTILVSDIERGLFLVRLGEDRLEFAFPDGVPETLRPGLPTRVRVEISEHGVTLDPATVRLALVNDGEPDFLSMTPDGEGGFVGELPAADCFETQEFWFTADDTTGLSHVAPFNAPAQGGFVAHVVTGSEEILADDFGQDRGWTVENDEASAGGWARVAPARGNDLEPEFDADGSGAACLTGSEPGESLVGGPIRLTSPAFDLGQTPHARFRYSLWHAAEGWTVAPLYVELSADGGLTWTVADRHKPEPGWTGFDIRVADYVPTTGSVRIRFSANNSTGQAVVEAGVDDFRIVTPLCEACIADYNTDGEVNTIDFISYLNDFTGATDIGDPDLNGDGRTDTLDFLLFLNLFTAGCG